MNALLDAHDEDADTVPSVMGPEHRELMFFDPAVYTPPTGVELLVRMRVEEKDATYEQLAIAFHGPRGFREKNGTNLLPDVFAWTLVRRPA